MKKLIVSLAIVLTAGAAPLLAHPVSYDPGPEKIFARQFAGAQNIRWSEISDGYHVVTFTLNGTAIEAFYDQDAELLGTIRVLFFNQLPLRVMQTINNRYADAVVIDVKEIGTPDATNYRVILEQKDKRYSLKINSDGDVVEKIKVKTNK